MCSISEKRAQVSEFEERTERHSLFIHLLLHSLAMCTKYLLYKSSYVNCAMSLTTLFCAVLCTIPSFNKVRLKWIVNSWTITSQNSVMGHVSFTLWFMRFWLNCVNYFRFSGLNKYIDQMIPIFDQTWPILLSRFTGNLLRSRHQIQFNLELETRYSQMQCTSILRELQYWYTIQYRERANTTWVEHANFQYS